MWAFRTSGGRIVPRAGSRTSFHVPSTAVDKPHRDSARQWKKSPLTGSKAGWRVKQRSFKPLPITVWRVSTRPSWWKATRERTRGCGMENLTLIPSVVLFWDGLRGSLARLRGRARCYVKEFRSSDVQNEDIGVICRHPDAARADNRFHQRFLWQLTRYDHAEF